MVKKSLEKETKDSKHSESHIKSANKIEIVGPCRVVPEIPDISPPSKVSCKDMESKLPVSLEHSDSYF